MTSIRVEATFKN